MTKTEAQAAWTPRRSRRSERLALSTHTRRRSSPCRVLLPARGPPRPLTATASPASPQGWGGAAAGRRRGDRRPAAAGLSGPPTAHRASPADREEDGPQQGPGRQRGPLAEKPGQPDRPSRPLHRRRLCPVPRAPLAPVPSPRHQTVQRHHERSGPGGKAGGQVPDRRPAHD